MGDESLSLIQRNETRNNRSTDRHTRGVWGCRNFPLLPRLNAYTDRDVCTYATYTDRDVCTYATYADHDAHTYADIHAHA